MWMSYSSPFTVFITLLAMTPTLGANIYFFLIIFLMIDRRDEYMLVQFILCTLLPLRSPRPQHISPNLPC